MSLNIKGRTCATCHAYLFEEDDVVFCPVCGAPHHRECYARTGHCALEEFHGTDNQYNPSDEIKHTEEKPQKETVCRFCNSKIDDDAKVCPYCGKPQGPVFIGYDFMGGVKEDTDIDGVKASEVRDFVAVNTHKYLPKFTILNENKRTSWNWTAFLFPEGWFFSRKMYKSGIIVLTAMLVAQILTMPLMNFLGGVSLPDTAAYAQYLAENMSAVGPLPLLMVVGSMLIAVLTRVISAMYGTYIYKKHAIKKIKEYSPSKEDRFVYNRKYGGVNIFLFLLGVMILNYLPRLIFMFM